MSRFVFLVLTLLALCFCEGGDADRIILGDIKRSKAIELSSVEKQGCLSTCVLCDDYLKFCYIKCAKTGSSLMQRSILPVWSCYNQELTGYGCPRFPGKCDARRVEYWENFLQKHRAGFYDDYFIFGLLRNPWDRYVSVYAYIKSECRSPAAQCVMENFPSFSEFCVNPLIYDIYAPKLNNLHWRDCTPRYFDPSTGRLLVDYVGTTEEMNRSTLEIKARIEANLRIKYGIHVTLPTPQLGEVRNKGSHGTFTEYYRENPHCISAIGSASAMDVEMGAYSYPRD